MIFFEGRKVGNFKKILFLLGFFISFSKVSLIIFVVIFIYLFKKIINFFSIFIVGVSFVLLLVFYWNYNVDYLILPENESYFHRFGAYLALLDLNIEQLIFGVTAISSLDSEIYSSLYKYGTFSGFAGYIVHAGILITFFTFLIYYILKIKPIGIFLLLLLTINVDLVTNQNFVVLSYFIILKYLRDNCYYKAK